MKYYRINGKKRKECIARGRGGMVVSASPFASEAGIAVMKKGGNAFDAAVAVSLVLAVVEPTCSGLGGNGFMTAYLASFIMLMSTDSMSAIRKETRRSSVIISLEISR